MLGEMSRNIGMIELRAVRSLLEGFEVFDELRVVC